MGGESAPTHGELMRDGQSARGCLPGNSAPAECKHAQRQAPNFVVQSTAADIFKFATVRVHEEVFKNTKSSIVNLVHDEIQSYVHKDELYLLNKKRDIMEDFDFLVPLKVDFAYSTTSWAEKKGLTI